MQVADSIPWSRDRMKTRHCEIWRREPLPQLCKKAWRWGLDCSEMQVPDSVDSMLRDRMKNQTSRDIAALSKNVTCVEIRGEGGVDGDNTLDKLKKAQSVTKALYKLKGIGNSRGANASGQGTAQGGGGHAKSHQFRGCESADGADMGGPGATGGVGAIGGWSPFIISASRPLCKAAGDGEDNGAVGIRAGGGAGGAQGSGGHAGAGGGGGGGGGSAAANTRSSASRPICETAGDCGRSVAGSVGSGGLAGDGAGGGGGAPGAGGGGSGSRGGGHGSPAALASAAIARNRLTAAWTCSAVVLGAGADASVRSEGGV